MSRSILLADLGNLIVLLSVASKPLTVNTASEVSVGSPLALALDNPDTPIARERKPVIKTLESLFSLEGFEREMSMLAI
jgi:hypothetical protein